MGNLGWTEILIILVIALIVFGPRKLPELGKSLGQSLAQFRRASEDFKRTWEDEVEIEKRRIEAPEPYPAGVEGDTVYYATDPTDSTESSESTESSDSSSSPAEQGSEVASTKEQSTEEQAAVQGEAK
jgi:TatA/E family protein of Tat protein translocase